MQTKFDMHKIHYYGTWESPPTKVGLWHIEVRGDKYYCFWNNKMMHMIYEGKETLSEAIQFCEDHYHQLLGEKYSAKASNNALK